MDILECVQLLLKHDAPVKVKNGLGWTVLAEAVSYGNRPTSKITFVIQILSSLLEFTYHAFLL